MDEQAARGLNHMREACPGNAGLTRATSATDRPSLPTCRQISTRARCVKLARGATAGCCSVHVLTGHRPSSQRQTRLFHTSRPARPPTGKSRTTRSWRSCNVATTPQPQHPVRVAIVSAYNHTSPSTSRAWTSLKPSKPNTTAPTVASVSSAT